MGDCRRKKLNAENYKRERKLRGTQIEVAAQLEVHQVTIARRETGEIPVTREAWLALISLPTAGNKSSQRTAPSRRR